MHAWLLTCPGREALCAATLAELARSDWGPAVTVVHDPGPGGSGDPLPLSETSAPAESESPTQRGYRALFTAALAVESGPFLVLENDLLIHPRLRHHLTRWAPLAEGRLHFGTLYNPGLRLLPDGTADPLRCFGGQARVFSPACARLALAALQGPGLVPDLRLARAAATLGPLWVHRPSLVQHTGRQSLWGGLWHEAVDWDPGWEGKL